MDNVLGSAYRGKGVLMYILKKANLLLEKSVGFRVKTVRKDKPYYVKDVFYVINALASVLFPRPDRPRCVDGHR